MTTARILIIAGSDSGGGAGIQADIKTVTMLGGHAMTAITAITAQNTVGVQAVLPISDDMIAEQMGSCIDDIGIDAVKIGMLPNEAAVRIVTGMLLAARPLFRVPIIVDPVLVSTSGVQLVADTVIAAIKSRLVPMATLLTPNLPELEALGGEACLTGPTLIKGGHGEGNRIIDRLIVGGVEMARWEGDRINTTSTHGTGCTLASAIATGLGQGMDMIPAIERAIAFVRAALLAAPGFGAGHGPMGHQSVDVSKL
jgi:hydroxymethylpyrimidine/phosphomethylpyrimidine kinase